MTIIEQIETTTDYDPITFSVLLSRFSSIAEEMTLTLEYTAWTSILALARDYSCAIYDAQSRQIAMFDALPIHTTSMYLVLDEIAKTFKGNINDGDVILCNAAYRGNTHVGDLVTATPVFVDGQHLFWSVTKGHQLDVGAAIPSSVSASAKNIWQEGIQIPPVKIYDRGVMREDVIDIFLSNVRYPDLQRGDLLAQLGSIGIGKQRLVELTTQYGIPETLRYVDAMLEYADRRTGEALRKFPDGEYFGHSWVDDDGVEATNIPINAKVTIQGDTVDIDFTGSGPQSVGGANGTLATSMAAPTIPFLYYLDSDIPHNQGCFGHFNVKLEEGTICLAKYPASTSVATLVPSDAMHEAVNRALATAIPELVTAGSARGANMPNFSGIDSRTGKPWAAMFFNGAGGAGAAKGNDGWPLISTLGAMGGLKSISCEQLELLYPLHVEMMEVEPDSMGAGTFIGGPGIRFVVSPVPGAGDVECITFGDGCENPPHGVLGGTPGIGGGQYAENMETGHKRFVSTSGFYMVSENERRVGISTGGGGYGVPWERDAELVRRDVRDGFVSREAAKAVYGVVLSEDYDPAIDEAATRNLRDELSTSDVAPVNPVVPSSATWLKTNMGPNDTHLLCPTGE